MKLRKLINKHNIFIYFRWICIIIYCIVMNMSITLHIQYLHVKILYILSIVHTLCFLGIRIQIAISWIHAMKISFVCHLIFWPHKVIHHSFERYCSRWSSQHFPLNLSVILCATNHPPHSGQQILFRLVARAHGNGQWQHGRCLISILAVMEAIH